MVMVRRHRDTDLAVDGRRTFKTLPIVRGLLDRVLECGNEDKAITL